jgi:hypothetical protein
VCQCTDFALKQPSVMEAYTLQICVSTSILVCSLMLAVKVLAGVRLGGAHCMSSHLTCWETADPVLLCHCRASPCPCPCTVHAVTPSMATVRP